jgi:CheY-like chemotaxis protein
MLRILIVDDHPDTADAVGMLLEAIGHETTLARTGAEALEAVERFAPDLVILDIGLPDLSGYEVARAIRARPLGAAIHLVAATGWGTAEDRVRALAAGFDQHQLKPLDLRKLEAMIATAMNRVTMSDPGGASSSA